MHIRVKNLLAIDPEDEAPVKSDLTKNSKVFLFCVLQIYGTLKDISTEINGITLY